MELAEVKNYFENAEKVKDYKGDKGIVELDKFEISVDGSVIQNPFEKNWLVLWHSKKGFAKIITTKEPSFSITKERLRQLTDPKVKEWFPEVFEVKLEVGKWYKNISTKLLYFPLTIKDSNNINAYGFDANGQWSDNNGLFKWGTPKELALATEQEVFEALKNEAVKRGFVEGAYFIEPENCVSYSNQKRLIKGNVEAYSEDNSMLCMSGTSSLIYKKGIWATIIQTITKSEAEKLLNKKITD